jgi:hypothetical protein
MLEVSTEGFYDEENTESCSLVMNGRKNAMSKKNEMRYLQQAESSAIRFSYIEPKLPTGR